MTEAWAGDWDGFYKALKAQPIGTALRYLEYASPFVAGSIYLNSDHGPILADGREVTVAVYPSLYRVIGNTYGGNRGNTFKLPDLQGRIVDGSDIRIVGGPDFGEETAPGSGLGVDFETGAVAADVTEFPWTPWVTLVLVECGKCSALVMDKPEARANHEAWHKKVES
jgi:hypothetical protein